MNLLARDRDNCTALTSACLKGDVDICQFLLLSIRERHGEKELSNVLKQRTRRKGKTCLDFAVEKGNELVKLLLRYGGGEHNLGGKGDKPGKTTPLHFASKAGKLEMVKILADFSDLFAEDDEGNTPFSLASSFGHVEILKYILELLKSKGNSKEISALLNHPSRKGLTPLILASKADRFEEVKV